MKKSIIICIALALLSLSACSAGKDNANPELGIAESHNETDLNTAYEEGYSNAIHEIEGVLSEWRYCVCVDPEDLSDAIVEYGISAGLSDEEAEDLRDMILSDLDGISMDKIISAIGD